MLQAVCYGLFLALSLIGGGIHCVMSVWSLHECADGDTHVTCGGPNWSANFLLAEVNMTMGLTVFVLSFVAMLVAGKVFSTVWRMSKVEERQQKEMMYVSDDGGL